MQHQRNQYYTAKEAQDKLGLNKAKFYKLVRQGLIPTLALPGMTQRMYPKRDIDALAYSLTRQAPVFEFSTSSLADLVEEMKIATKCFDHNFVIALNERIAFQQKSRFTYHSLKMRGVVVGSVAMFRLTEPVLNNLLIGRTILKEIKVGDILPFVRLEYFNVFLDVVVVDPDLPAHLRKLCGGLLLYYFLDLISHILMNNYQITHIYTIGYTEEGQKLLRKLGFAPVPGRSLAPHQQVFVYDLDEVHVGKLQEKVRTFSYHLRHLQD